MVMFTMGLLVGGGVGLLIAALCTASKEADKKEQ